MRFYFQEKENPIKKCWHTGKAFLKVIMTASFARVEVQPAVSKQDPGETLWGKSVQHNRNCNLIKRHRFIPSRQVWTDTKKLQNPLFYSPMSKIHCRSKHIYKCLRKGRIEEGREGLMDSLSMCLGNRLEDDTSSFLSPVVFLQERKMKEGRDARQWKERYGPDHCVTINSYSLECVCMFVSVSVCVHVSMRLRACVKYKQ